jgi:exodeoxyribonuclease X
MSGCAYILDTETTDAGDAPEVIQLAIMGPMYTPLTDAPTATFRYKPGKPISIGAMATHNIIAEDLEASPPWVGYTLPSDCAYIIGHAIDFDWRAIGSPNVKRICTLALSRSLWPDIDSHKLTALMYHIHSHKFARALVKGAHDAEADVCLCLRLLLHLYEEQFDDAMNWEQIWRMSEEARIPKVFSFGKYKGEEISHIKAVDGGYINWCLSGKCDLVNEDEYLRRALTR